MFKKGRNIPKQSKNPNGKCSIRFRFNVSERTTVEVQAPICKNVEFCVFLPEQKSWIPV